MSYGELNYFQWIIISSGFALSLVYVAMVIIPFRYPKFACDCRSIKRTLHFGNKGLFIEACIPTFVAVTDLLFLDESIIDYVLTALVAFIAYMDWRDWWRHSKGSRKKLGEKILGRVKITVSGLKVVPVHG